MAENSRGQGRSGQQNQSEQHNQGKSGNQRSNTSNSSFDQDRQNASSDKGMADMNQERRSIGTERQERGSGISTKRSVTGSDYDGQLSDE